MRLYHACDGIRIVMHRKGPSIPQEVRKWCGGGAAKAGLGNLPTLCTLFHGALGYTKLSTEFQSTVMKSVHKNGGRRWESE
eukprot:scaffold30466_cov69-Skeletonema_dohrnii-CCMP3373.AAC.3